MRALIECPYGTLLLNVLLTLPFVAQTGRKWAGQAVCPHVEGGLSQTTTDNTRSATMKIKNTTRK